MPGRWSPSPLKVILCPSFIPGSMWTCNQKRYGVLYTSIRTLPSSNKHHTIQKKSDTIPPTIYHM